MAKIETWFNQDLKRAVKVQYIDGNVFSADNAGNVVGVNVFNDGQPATLGGSVSGSIIRADGVTVAVVGTLSGNKASITMPQSAYAVPGVISIIIKLTSGEDITTICAVVANVYQSTTDAIVDPGTIIPSIENLISEIEAAIASVPADYSSLWASIAPVFSSSNSYSIGDYVVYNGALYCFTSNHSGSWSSADVTSATLGGGINAEATARKDADDKIYETIWKKSVSIMPASRTGRGYYLEDGTYVQDNGWSSYYIPINGGLQYTVTFTGTTHPSNNLNEYDANGVFIKTHGRVANMTFTSDSNARYIGCAVINADVGTLDIIQLNVRGEIALVQSNLDAFEQHVEENVVMTRYSMVDVKTARPLRNISAGTTLYFRAVSTTDSSIEKLSVYGLNTGETAENIGSQTIGKDITQIVTTKSYEYIQVSLNPYPSGDFTGTVLYDFAISNVRGIIPDLYYAQAASVPRNLNKKIARIFRKVICIGDSYTAGYILLDGEERTIEPMYAWPHFMELETGNTWVNCGVSGANVFTWQSAENGYQKAVDSGRAQMYIIGLMINDRSVSERGVPLGVPADIGTDNYTYYAGMSQIVRRINALNPTAKIFINTLPSAPTEGGYNTAVRVIVDTYKNTYPVHCLDLARSELFTYMNPSFVNDLVGGHYTGIGYEQMAEVLCYEISKYIGENIQDFQNVHHIPFDE